MDGAQAGGRYPITAANVACQCVGGHGGFVVKLVAQGRVTQLLVQILVVVANIQMGTLKSEVEKGSM